MTVTTYDASARGFVAYIESRRPAWQADALCKEYPDVDWFADDFEMVLAAQRVCLRCPVKIECTMYSFTERIDGGGIWGAVPLAITATADP